MRGRHKPHRSAFLSLIPIVALLVTFVPAPARAVVSEPSAGPSIATQNDGPDSDTLRLLAGMAGKDVLRVKGTFGEFTGMSPESMRLASPAFARILVSTAASSPRNPWRGRR